MTPPTLLDGYTATVAAHADAPAYRRLGGGDSLTWRQADVRVRAIARGLYARGVRRGDRVALLLRNRIEFHLVDLAALSIGATPFSLYVNSAPAQVRYVVSNAGAKLLVTEAALVEGAAVAASGAPVLLVDEGPSTFGSLAALEHEGARLPEDPLHAARAAARPDDLATLIYTSGTTGDPKGVRVTHGNVLAAARAFSDVSGGHLGPGSTTVSYLPLAHIAERDLSHYFAFLFGFEVWPLADLAGLGAALREVRPHLFFGVPRTWEKLKAGVEAESSRRPEAIAVAGATRLAIDAVDRRQHGEGVDEATSATLATTDARIFAPLRGAIGLDRIEVAIVGAAPSAPSMISWWHAIGVPLIEVWGMSETTGIGANNAPGATRIGSVGRVNPECEITLSGEGEILIRGAVVSPGYYGDPARTAAAFEGSWLRTGDIGRFDADAYLTIVDRKKELIIGSGGKNISPAHLEARLKATPLIGQACVVGDGRDYLTALLVLDPDVARAFALAHDLDPDDRAALVGSAAVRKAVDEAVGRVNGEVSRAERIRRYTLLPDEWAPGGDELTPTMKLRRKPIAARYAPEIESMYRT